MPTDPTTLEQFSDRQPLPGASGNSLLANLDGAPVRLRRLPLTPDAVTAARQQLAAAAGISHPAIVPDSGLLVQDGEVWVWRPELEGEAPVSDDQEQRLAFAQRTCEALGLIHRAGFAHGAVDGTHLIMTPADGLKLVDPTLDAAATPTQDMQALGRVLFEWETGQSAQNLQQPELAAALTRQAAQRPLPPRLARLILQLLSEEPPAATLAAEDLEDIRLSLARADAQVQAHWQTESYEPVKAVKGSTPSISPVQPAAQPQSKAPAFIATAAACVLLLAIVFVVGVLPDRVAPEPEPVAETAAAEPEPAAPEPPPAAAPLSQADLERLLRQRESAQAVLDELINLQLELEEQQVERWAERRFGEARDLAASGDEPFREQNFELAEATYIDALEEMKAVAALRPIIVAEALERGRYAFERGRAVDADDAYSLALAIDPENEQAKVGKARSETLDRVKALMADVMLARDELRLADALSLLDQVLALDPLTEAAAALKGELQTELADARFRNAMSDGLAALSAGRWQEARTALNRAAKLEPANRAPKDALIELERRQRDALVARDIGKARTAQDQERWEAAIKHFDDILKRDPNSRVAQEGRAQAVERQDLDQRLTSLLRDPVQLWSNEGRSTARSLLYDARAIEGPGPRLRDQLVRLDQQIDLAARPQPVTLESDNACNVVVYKVARLGQFDRHQLELLPGRYTAVGTRDGYRDVRVEFMVPAGQAPQPVSLRCEEQVLARG
ncbi:MAG: hypothetical protein AAF736_16350 [Pseudomonadota bacterium]